MKNLILILCIAASAMAQRPSYAGLSAKGVPGLASRFRTDSSSGSSSSGIGSRNGGTDGNNVNIPYDEYMANRYNEWPRENRPFSHTNAEVIRQHLGRPSSSTVNQPNGSGNGATSGNSLGSNQSKPNQVLNSRFGGSSNPQTNNNSFSIVMNGQWRTYRYNEITDSWVRSQ
ncbi:unnamed protein product [Phyllotreta striolata]|uniref:Uncharacterized protein n=1 Tax=Phyllotreta striolata TaxID=444603 RepID=A0A9N9TIF3_PHYSR|nr:unnamed protein product [Phyllotreta striolata]